MKKPKTESEWHEHAFLVGDKSMTWAVKEWQRTVSDGTVIVNRASSDDISSFIRAKRKDWMEEHPNFFESYEEMVLVYSAGIKAMEHRMRKNINAMIENEKKNNQD